MRSNQVSCAGVEQIDHRVAHAMRLMEQRIGDEFSIAEIAACFGLSLHHFHRLFLAETNETPAGYLRRIRLDAGAQHLHWTHLSVGSIAYSVGYRSQASFTRAFAARFGETPERYRKLFSQDRPFRNEPGKVTSIALRDVERFHVLARRYVGDQHEVRSYWNDFMERLPNELRGVGNALFMGLFHDDPRITPASQARYDCCVTVGADFRDCDGSLARRGLYLTHTHPGSYACLDHRGPRTAVEASYRIFTDAWSQRGRLSGEHPAIELHVIPRNLQNPEDLSFTILMALQ